MARWRVCGAAVDPPCALKNVSEVALGLSQTQQSAEELTGHRANEFCNLVCLLKRIKRELGGIFGGCLFVEQKIFANEIADERGDPILLAYSTSPHIVARKASRHLLT